MRRPPCPKGGNIYWWECHQKRAATVARSIESHVSTLIISPANRGLTKDNQAIHAKLLAGVVDPPMPSVKMQVGSLSMSRALGSLFRTTVRRTRILLHGRPRCLQLARSVVRNKRGLEIGGPSSIFRKRINLPIYDAVGTLDNCDFAKATVWANHEDAYRFHPNKTPGHTYFTEGNSLSEIPEHSYDFLLSSHNLEHFANPLKALKEWQRIVKPSGHLIIVLPNYLQTLDRRRTPTTLSHMVQDFEQNIGENDLTHVEETVQGQRLDGLGAVPAVDLQKLLQDNFSHRMMHHHVFHKENSRQLLEALGCTVLAVETQLPHHIYLIAQLPSPTRPH